MNLVFETSVQLFSQYIVSHTLIHTCGCFIQSMACTPKEVNDVET